MRGAPNPPNPPMWGERHFFGRLFKYLWDLIDPRTIIEKSPYPTGSFTPLDPIGADLEFVTGVTGMHV